MGQRGETASEGSAGFGGVRHMARQGRGEEMVSWVGISEDGAPGSCDSDVKALE